MERDAKGRFLKGKSGNAGGRPKGLADQCRSAVRDGTDLVQFYLDAFRGSMDWMTTDDDGNKIVKRTAIKPELRMEAAEWLTERGWGKAVQLSADVSGMVKVYEGVDLDRV